jgi:hypothetical protein
MRASAKTVRRTERDGGGRRKSNRIWTKLDSQGMGGAVRQTRESVEETGGDAKGLESLPVGRRKPVLTD